MFDSEEMICSEEELQDLCREWQETLNLQFWSIMIRICRAREFKMENPSQAECSWEIRNAMALISILDPTDYPSSPFPQDMEKSLVHELIHLHFAPFDDFAEDSLQCDMLERAVNELAKSLVNLKRKGMKEECQELMKKSKSLKLKPKVGSSRN